jgi:NADPH:quinone reductase-like Zn-dependent oxidoreductase
VALHSFSLFSPAQAPSLSRTPHPYPAPPNPIASRPPPSPLCSPHLTALCELVAQGRLRAAIDTQRFVGVESAAAAVDRLQSGASSGKVVLQVAPELPAAAVAGL